MAYKAIKYEPAGDVTKLGGALRRLISIPAAGVANVASKTATAIANKFADDRTADQKYKDSVDAVQQQLGGGLGSSAGSTRIGPSTPAGTIPIASFNMGNNASVAPAAPAKQATITDIGTTFGDVGLPKMGPKDLPRLSSGALPTGKPARRAPVRNAGTKPVATAPTAAAISEVPNGGLQTPGYQVPGTNNITQIDNVAPGQFNSDFGPQGVAAYNTPAGGGIASNGDETFVLRGRTPAEEAAFKTQQAQAQNTQPITALAGPTQQTSTVGYGNGIETYGSDGSLISSTRKLDSNASIGDLLMEKFNTNQQSKKAGIANINSEIVSRGNKDSIAAAGLPFDIAEKAAITRNKNFATDSGIALLPLELQNSKSIIANRDSEKTERDALLPIKRENYKSEIEYRKASTDNAAKRLSIYEKQEAQRVKSAAQTQNVPDFALIEKIGSGKLKAYNDILAMGGQLTKEQLLDMKKQNARLEVLQEVAFKPHTTRGSEIAQSIYTEQ